LHNGEALPKDDQEKQQSENWLKNNGRKKLIDKNR